MSNVMAQAVVLGLGVLAYFLARHDWALVLALLVVLLVRQQGGRRA